MARRSNHHAAFRISAARRFTLPEILEPRLLFSTYYIDDTGSDGGSGTTDSPWATFTRAYTAMQGGDTLIVKDGTYVNRVVLDRFSPPPDGSAAAGYTTVRAEHFGSVVIEGRGIEVDAQASNPVRYLHFDGLVFRRQPSGTSLMGSVDHIKFTRCGFEDAADGNDQTFNLGRGASYILVEDCFAWGSGRYKFSCYHASNVVFRRCVARFDRVNAQDEPIAAFAFYASDRVQAQNCVSIDGDRPQFWQGVYEYSGSFYVPSTDGPSTNINVTGSVALNVAMQFGGLTKDLDKVTFSNSVGWHIREGMIARDSAAFDHMTFGDVYGPRLQAPDAGFTWYEGDDPVNTLSLRNSVVQGVRGAALTDFATEDYNVFWANNADRGGQTPVGPHSVNADPALKYILRPSDGSAAVRGRASDGTDVGATVVKRTGVSGTLYGEAGYDAATSEDLWPFPNEDVIGSFMRSYRYTSAAGTLSGDRGFAAAGQTLTNYVWGYLGNASPYGGDPAVAPAAPDALAAAAAAAAGSGRIDLSWADNADNETAYLLERRTGAAGAWAQVAQLGLGATAYSDTGLSASTRYDYRVRAANAAGNSA
jgi:hypothetical protein